MKPIGTGAHSKLVIPLGTRFGPYLGGEGEEQGSWQVKIEILSDNLDMRAAICNGQTHPHLSALGSTDSCNLIMTCNLADWFVIHFYNAFNYNDLVVLLAFLMIRSRVMVSLISGWGL